MKLSKTTLIFLGVGIFAILAIGMGMAYAQQSKEQSRLNEQLSLAQLRLSTFAPQKLSPKVEGLEGELAKLETQLKDTKALLCQSRESIEATDTLFDIAEVYDVQIIGISSPGLSDKEIEGIACPVLTVMVQLEGDVPNLIDFAVRLSEEFTTGVIQSVGIAIPEVPEEEEAEEEVGEGVEKGEKPTASIVLIVHTYEDDQSG